MICESRLSGIADLGHGLDDLRPDRAVPLALMFELLAFKKLQDLGGAAHSMFNRDYAVRAPGKAVDIFIDNRPVPVELALNAAEREINLLGRGLLQPELPPAEWTNELFQFSIFN